MTDWLFKEDDYIVKEDNNRFIEKSTFSVLEILSRISRSNEVESTRKYYGINPAVKLFFSIFIIILVSISRDTMYLLVVFFAIVINIFFLRKIHIKKIYTVVSIAVAFTAIMLIPSIITGNMKNSIMILAKIFINVSLVNILSYTTKWSNTSKALRLFFVPDSFILVLEVTLRYIYILGESALEMLYALKLRSVGTNRNKYRSLSGVIGNLFLKSKDMGEEVYSAMECRGFTGEYSSKIEVSFRVPEIIYILCNIILIAAFIYTK